jgi:molybdopterin-guanine dinucleotide biosynthesis protein A
MAKKSELEAAPLPQDFAGYVLAGGASSRLGRDKALIELGGKSLLLHAADLLRSVVPRVTVVASRPEYAALGLSIIPDDWPGSGPLGGIVTALRHSALDPTLRDWNLILGCDLPFITREWLEFLVRRSQHSSANAIVPVSSTGLEPLCALYRTSCASELAASLDRGVRKIAKALEVLHVEYIAASETIVFDSHGRLFKNMNTSADLDEVQAAWKTERR